MCVDVAERGHRSHRDEVSALLQVAAPDRPEISDDESPDPLG